MKTTLKSNLILGLSLSLIILIISSLASYVSIRKLIQSSGSVQKSNELILNLEKVLSALKDAETGQRGYLLTGNKVFLEPYRGSSESALRLLNNFKDQLSLTSVQQKQADELINIIKKRLDILKSTIEIKNLGGEVDPMVLLQGKVYMDQARQITNDIIREEKQRLSHENQKLDQFIGYTPLLIMIAAILAILITLYFYRKISIDYNERIKLNNQLETNNYETVNRIKAIQKVAQQISNGNYNLRLDSLANDHLGELSSSLNAMASSLHSSFKKLEESEWLQTGIASLNIKMVGEKDIFSLADDIIEFLTNYTNSQIGTIYIFKDDGYLHLKGKYAVHAEGLPDVLEIGQGLIGQCVKSAKPIILKDIPKNELNISHASGTIVPTQIIVYPIIRNNITIGAIEMGTITTYTDLQTQFLALVNSEIGSALLSAQNRLKLQQLLEETQAQSEELQVQQNELENINAELEAQSQRLQVSEEELRVQQEELLQSNQELEDRNSLLEQKNDLIAQRNAEIQDKAKALELSTKYKSEFLANMSHELRTPLNSILLLSRLMAENESLAAEHKEYAEVIQSSGQGLLSLIDEILDLSKIEAGKMNLELEDIEVQDIVQSMQTLFKPLAREKNLELHFNISENSPKFLHTDKMRIEQILKNLLSNAIKFTSKGSVSLSVTKNELSKSLVFKVADTGIGISKEKQKIVFEAFQQADGSTRRKFGGTGLGLSISRELAKLLNGDIVLTSEEQEGSEFSLIIPLEPQEVLTDQETVATEETPLTADETVNKLTVKHIPDEIEDDRNNIGPNDRVLLIIEDDTPFAKTLLNFTRKNKYKGIVAVRGDVGIEMAIKYHPVAILLDIQLPVKDGWQVMDELKANPITKPIPVHIMSSLKARKESLLKGAIDFINKPFAFEQMHEVFKKLEHALSREPKKVLIIEENEQHAKALSYFLQNFNIQTEVVTEAEKSVEALHKPEINCVIFDMGVPDKTSYNTLDLIKKTPGLEDLPIIIFTGKNLSKGEEARIKKYADSIVLKTAHSYQRILDEASLFLHLVESKNQDKNTHANKFAELQDVLANKTVLIADDDVRNIFSLTKTLEQHKMRVLTATDGKEALKLLGQSPAVDIVLMDMMMPELDGYETTSLIRKNNKYKNLPILAVTAKAMMGDREKCIAAGASDYISKPVDMDQLISLLRVWLYESHHS